MLGLRAWKIGRIMGIPISVDPSWFIIFGLLTYELATGLFPFEIGLGRWRGINLEGLALGAFTSLLLFGSVLAHELSHSWMAIRRGIPVLGITLFIFGGVAQIGDEPDRPSTEFLVAIMGPLMSVALAAVFAIFWIWPSVISSFTNVGSAIFRPLIAMAYYLATANAILVLFNLIPGFPLDGGRVFRAFLWGVVHDLAKATRFAMIVGRGIASLMALLAGWLILRGDLNAVWFLLIAGFIWQAAGEAYRSVLLRESLRQVRVDQLMHSPIARVAGEMGLPGFVDQYLVPHRGDIFAVDQRGQTVGLISPLSMRRVPRSNWGSMCVSDVMLPLSAVDPVGPQDSALKVMQKLARHDGDGMIELPVFSDGQLVGVVGQNEIARYLQWKSQ